MNFIILRKKTTSVSKNGHFFFKKLNKNGAVS